MVSFSGRLYSPEEDLGDKIGVLDEELLPVAALDHLSGLGLDEVENLLSVLRIRHVKVYGDERLDDAFGAQVFHQGNLADLHQILKILV